ncbi:MAG: type II toxin-antitoxin system HicB family antitoxin [Acidobacteria bacterium]|nr:type II toxin-antitoxin system HicB family antitoxin [Acidobacteriota bacterium]
MEFSYPAIFSHDTDGITVSFADLPEAWTSGKTMPEAIAQAEDCLETAIGSRIKEGDEVPMPSPAKRGQQLITLGPVMAAKASLYGSMRTSGMTKSELARRLGVDVKEARRLLDPWHPTKLPRLMQALALFGQRLVVTIKAA